MIAVPQPIHRAIAVVAQAPQAPAPAASTEWTKECDFHLSRCRQEIEAATNARDQQIRLIHLRLAMLHSDLVHPNSRAQT